MSTPQLPPSYIYDAFMSYNQAADGGLAPYLQRAIQGFSRPWYKLRSSRLFRDSTGFSVTDGLWPAIERSIGQSRHFILLASQQAAQSRWVHKEVDYWKTLGRPKPLIVLTDGEIVWDANTGDFDWAKTTALPRSASKIYDSEPLFLKLRDIRSKDLSARHPELRQAAAGIFAAMFDRKLDEVIGDDIKQYRRTWLISCGAIAVIAAAIIWAFTATGMARFQSSLADARMLLEQSNVLANLSRGDLPASAVLAIEAYKKFQILGDIPSEADSALRRRISLMASKVELPPSIRLPGSPSSALLDDTTGRVIVSTENRAACLISIATPSVRCTFYDVDVTELIQIAPRRYLMSTEDGACLLEDREGVLAAGGCEQRLGKPTKLAALGNGRAAALFGEQLCLLDLQVTGPVIGNCLELAEEIKTIVASRDGSRLAYALDDRICLVATNQLQSQANNGEVTSCPPKLRGRDIFAISDSGDWIVVQSLDRRSVSKRSTADGSQIWQFSSDRELRSASVAEDLSRMAIINWDRKSTKFEVRIVDLGGGFEVSNVSHFAPVNFARLDGPGEFLVTTSGQNFPPDDTVSLWRATTGEELIRVVGGKDPAFAVRLNAAQILIGAGDGGLGLWKVDSGSEPLSVDLGKRIRASALSRDGIVAYAGDDKVCIASSTRRGRCYETADTPSSFAFEAGGLKVAAGQEICSIELRTGQRACAQRDVVAGTIRVSPDGAKAIAETASGVCLISAGMDNGNHGTCIPGTRGLTPVLLSPQGVLAALQGEGNVWTVADVTSGRRLISIDANKGDREASVFSADGRYFAYSDVTGDYRESQVVVWSIDEAKVLARLDHPGRVYSLAFSPDDRYLAVAAGSGRGNVQVWDWRSEVEVSRLSHARPVTAVVFAADGTRVYSLSHGSVDFDGTMRSWWFDSSAMLEAACARLKGLPAAEDEAARWRSRLRLGASARSEPLCAR